MLEDIDYSYIYPATDDETVHIKLLQGPYKDTVFKYGKVKFEEKNDEGYLVFAYDVIKSDVMKPRKLEKNEEFKNHIGNLLIEIINGNLNQEIIDENGTTDSDEFNS